MQTFFRNGITKVPEARRAIDEGRSWVFSDYKSGDAAIPAGTTLFWSIVNSSRHRGLWMYYPVVTTPHSLIAEIDESDTWTLGGQPYAFTKSNPVKLANRSRTEYHESLSPYFRIYVQSPNLVRVGGEVALIETVAHNAPSDIPALFLGPNERYVLSLKNITTSPMPYGIEISIEQDY